MDSLKTELNEYLFLEFDVDGDESRVSEECAESSGRGFETRFSTA